INAALRRMGYTKDEMTGHGFRSMASTLLNEQGWRPDAIERQLAHCEEDDVRAAYNYAEYLPERRKMMQAWADYLDALRCEKRSQGAPRIRVYKRSSHQSKRTGITSAPAGAAVTIDARTRRIASPVAVQRSRDR